jgi:hypothetical protein
MLRLLELEILNVYIYISYYCEGEGENVRNTVKQPRLSNGHLFILFEFRTHKGT